MSRNHFVWPSTLAYPSKLDLPLATSRPGSVIVVSPLHEERALFLGGVLRIRSYGQEMNSVCVKSAFQTLKGRNIIERLICLSLCKMCKYGHTDYPYRVI
jgi:hypothetical protein